jgi:hypothetical protein
MSVDLDRNDIVNLLAALNALQVSGKDAMQTVLRLMAKLEAAMAPPETEPE